MAPRLFFVTGTDTDVGKTVVAAGLLRAAGRLGMATLAVKPVAAGCEPVDGRLENEDAHILQREASIALDYADLNPVALAPAIAPHIAAAQAGVALSAAALVAHCRSLFDLGPDWMVVEGAGGWLVPLNRDETLADFCEALEAEVILVVGMRLGCLNHALLTLADVERRGIALAGWVANCIDPGMPEQGANLATLIARIDAPCLGRIPHLAADGQEIVETIAKTLDLERLG